MTTHNQTSKLTHHHSTPLIPILLQTLPFALGSILTAALLQTPSLSHHYHHHHHHHHRGASALSFLALATLLTVCAHLSTLAGWGGISCLGVEVGGYFLIGVSHTLALAGAVADLVCDGGVMRRGEGGGGGGAVGEKGGGVRGISTSFCGTDGPEGGYPPPPSRDTVVGALFGFGYHAVAAAVPAVVGLVRVGQGGGVAGQNAVAWMAAAFRGGMVVGRVVLLLLLWHGDKPPQKQSVFGALVLGAALLLVLPLFPVAAGSTVAAAALVGLTFGPVYPWVLCVLVCEMGEHERLGGIGIIVAFGNTGTAAGLFATSLIACSGHPLALYAVVVGVFGGMLVCWKSLSDGRRGLGQ